MATDAKRQLTAAVNRGSRDNVNVKKLTKQLAGIMAHLEQHPTDALSRARVDKIKELLRGA